MRLEGRVSAKDKLLSVELQYAGQPWKTLSGTTTPLAETFELRPVIDLVPDRDEPRQTIRLRARAINDASESAARVTTLSLEYRPSVPRLDLLAIEPRGPIVRPGTGGEPARVKLSARLLDVARASSDRAGRGPVR